MLQKVAETFYYEFNMKSEILRPNPFLHKWNYCNCKLDEVVPDKANFIPHTFDDRLNKEGIFEDAFTVSFRLCIVKITLEEYDFK